jgi:lichenan operon transcriptional antiterminator
MHIYGLVERVRNQVRMEDVFVEEIKRKYPLVFEMGIYVLEFLEEKLKAPISDAESCYIALHLGAASERMKAERKYRAVMILPHNQSFSDMCVKKISDMFRERMEVVKVFGYFEEEAVSSLAPDLLLSTFSLEHRLNVETVPINLFVDSETESRILQAINRLDKKGFRLEFSSHMGSLIRREHYHTEVNSTSPEEIIRMLCSGLVQAGAVEPEFTEVVLKREQMSPTSFVNTFAIPHAFGSFAKNSTIAVAQLKNPVKWGVFEVRLVMLFAINKGDARMIKIFFDWISNIVNQPEELAKLAAPCGYEEFIDRIME